jgi:hypothetical protein
VPYRKKDGRCLEVLGYPRGLVLGCGPFRRFHGGIERVGYCKCLTPCEADKLVTEKKPNNRELSEFKVHPDAHLTTADCAGQKRFLATDGVKLLPYSKLLCKQ